MSEAIWFLKRCPLFEHLSADECRRLEARAIGRSFPRRSVLYFPDEPGESVVLLTRGRVKILALTPDGREMIFAFIEPGELIGELAVLDPAPRNERAEAVEDSYALAIPRDEVLWLMGQRPEIALSVTKLIGLRLRRVENRLKNLLFRSIRERALLMLLELLDSHGRPVGRRWEINLRLSHQEFANLIGATRETITLTFGQLQKEGLIEIRRRRITILDRDRIAEEACGVPATPDTPIARRAHSGQRVNR
jgi:CRP/FNR family cyclic AMP-dependent transcriptional regulator